MTDTTWAICGIAAMAITYLILRMKGANDQVREWLASIREHGRIMEEWHGNDDHR